jgi:D-alanine transaminase
LYRGGTEVEYAILNGELIERKDAKVDIEDRGYQFGDGVYEVIRVYNGKMFTVENHLNRLSESCEKIGLNPGYTKGELKTKLEELIGKNKIDFGTVYLQYSRGISPRNHAFPGGDVPAAFVAYTREAARPEDNIKSGIKAILTEDIRWLRCDIKSLNLLGNLLAKQKAAQSGCFEAIQHRGDIVTEGSSSNVFIVSDGKLVTHPADHFILNGISRQKVLEISRENDIPYEEKPFAIGDLLGADEVFISSTTAEVMPVIGIDGSPVKDGKPGKLTQKLQGLFLEKIEKECGSIQTGALNS